MGRTLFEKVWNAHLVRELPGRNALIYIDRAVLYELLGPPAIEAIERDFEGVLYDAERVIAVNDHVAPAKDTSTAELAQQLRTWAKKRGVRLYDVGNNGICHVLVPERGHVMPGSTLVCSDSHTCTIGAFASFAFGVGSTALAGALLSSAVIVAHPKVMRITVRGRLQKDASTKDLALAVVAQLGFKGG